MKKNRMVKISSLLLAGLSLAACGGGGSSDDAEAASETTEITSSVTASLPAVAVAGDEANMVITMTAGQQGLRFAASGVDSAISLDKLDLPAGSDWSLALTNEDDGDSCFPKSGIKTLNAGESCEIDLSARSETIQHIAGDIHINTSAEDFTIPVDINFVDAFSELLEQASSIISEVKLLPNAIAQVTAKNIGDKPINNLRLVLPDWLSIVDDNKNLQHAFNLDAGESYTFSFQLAGDYYGKLTSQQLDDLLNNATSDTPVIKLKSANAKTAVPSLMVSDIPVDLDGSGLKLDRVNVGESISFNNPTNSTLTILLTNLSDLTGVDIDIAPGDAIDAQSADKLYTINLLPDAESGELVVVYKDESGNEFTSKLELPVNNGIESDKLTVSETSLFTLAGSGTLANEVYLTNNDEFNLKLPESIDDFNINSDQISINAANSDCVGKVLAPGASCKLSFDVGESVVDGEYDFSFDTDQLDSMAIFTFNATHNAFGALAATAMPDEVIEGETLLYEAEITIAGDQNDMQLTGVSFPNDDFSLRTVEADSCRLGQVFAAGDACTVYVEYPANTLGDVSGQIIAHFKDTQTNEVHDVMLEDTVDFSVVSQDQAGDALNLTTTVEVVPGGEAIITIDNTSDVEINNLSVDLSGDFWVDIIESQDILQIDKLAPGKTHEFTIQFKDTDAAKDVMLANYSILSDNINKSALKISSSTHKAVVPVLDFSLTPFVIETPTFDTTVNPTMVLQNLTDSGITITKIESALPGVSYDGEPQSLASFNVSSFAMTVMPSAEGSGTLTVYYTDEAGNEKQETFDIKVDNSILGSDLAIEESILLASGDLESPLLNTVKITNQGEFDWSSSDEEAAYTLNLVDGMALDKDNSTCIDGTPIAPQASCDISYLVSSEATGKNFSFTLEPYGNLSTNFIKDMAITQDLLHLSTSVSMPENLIEGSQAKVTATVINNTDQAVTIGDLILGEHISIDANDCPKDSVLNSGESCEIKLTISPGQAAGNDFATSLILQTGDHDLTGYLNARIVSADDAGLHLPVIENGTKLNARASQKTSLIIDNTQNDEALNNISINLPDELKDHIVNVSSVLTLNSIDAGGTGELVIQFDDELNLEDAFKLSLMDNVNTKLVTIDSANGQIIYPEIDVEPSATSIGVTNNNPSPSPICDTNQSAYRTMSCTFSNNGPFPLVDSSGSIMLEVGKSTTLSKNVGVGTHTLTYSGSNGGGSCNVTVQSTSCGR